MIAFALAAVVALAAGAPVPPAPTRWVEDHAGFLSPGTRGELDRKLEGYQQATGHQVVVWIGDTIGDAALDDWAVRTFESWKVGRKGIDDGIVMFILATDRTIDIEVGYGLEDRVPDAIASRIIREVMTPRLQADDRDGAVTAGVDALLAAIEGRPWSGDGAPPAATTWTPSTLQKILGVLAVIGFLILAVTHPRLALVLLWSMAGSRGGGFGGGGGGGGGFFGGGGRSGGGGARGKW